MDNILIVESVNDQKGYMHNVRKHLHEYPELSGHEEETSALLMKEATSLGLTVEKVSKTGFIAILDTGRPGKTLGLRTDIDALPIQENSMNLKQEKKVVSKNKSVSHACGHDGHMAILLSAMRILVANQERLNGKIIFIFEEGEETGSGIDPMISHLQNKEIDAFYGNHLSSLVDTGKICLDSGPVMAGFAPIEFKILGKEGHGSRPDQAVNPINAGIYVLSNISGAWNNQLDVNETVTLGITQIHGGEANNVFPNELYIGGTLRFFNQNEGSHALDVFYNVATLTAKAHGCEIEVLNKMGAHPPVVNDEELSQLAIDSIKEIMPESIVQGIRWYASESFSKYSTLAPSLFALVGIKNDELGSGANHHTAEFDIDEDALECGLISMIKFTINYLKG